MIIDNQPNLNFQSRFRIQVVNFIQSLEVIIVTKTFYTTIQVLYSNDLMEAKQPDQQNQCGETNYFYYWIDSNSRCHSTLFGRLWLWFLFEKCWNLFKTQWDLRVCNLQSLFRIKYVKLAILSVLKIVFEFFMKAKFQKYWVVIFFQMQ